MKKIVALGVAAALVGGIAFADPASNPEVTSFNGNATVKWGMDLDAGKTGFKNETWTQFRVKLFDGGSKATSGDGVWGELVLKTAEDWDVGGASVTAAIDGKNDKNVANHGSYIDVAKLHFNDFYVGIKDGNCTVGEYLFDAAIRGYQTYGSNEKWITDKGPANYTQGIVAGYDNENFSLDVDFRSLADASTQYTNAYAVAAEAKLKDKLVSGLTADAGFAYQLSNEYYTAAATTNEVKRTQYLGTVEGEATRNGHVMGYGVNVAYKLPVGDYYVKPAVAFAGDIKTADYDYVDGTDTKVGKYTANHNELAFGVLFGFGGDQADNAGVPFLDADANTKKATPGVSVVVGLPLADTATTVEDKTYKSTEYNKALAVIAPAFYSGSLIENLKLGFYSEIVPLRFENPDMDKTWWDDKDKTDNDYTPDFGKTVWSNDDHTESKVWNNAKDKDGTLALAAAFGLAYTIKNDDVTITPKAGIRYANAAYVDNNIKGIAPLSSNPVFDNMGEQAVLYKETADTKTGYSRNKLSDGDYFNLKAGVDIDGAIPNTKFFVEYASANLLNKIDFKAEKPLDDNNPNYKIGSGANKFGFYNQKLGTVNVGCQIHF